MTGILLHYRDIIQLYGLTEYETRELMKRIPRINISNGTVRPRWVVKKADVDAYLLKRTQRNEINGLDMYGRILRKR